MIATYQRPDVCERALLSALAQTVPPLEVLVCDDGSADDTASRAREWERRDPAVRYLRVERNTGLPARTRNRGIAQARGDWIAFLDDDDEWLPEKLERQLEIAAAEGADVVAANARRSDGSLYLTAQPLVHRPTRAEFLRHNPLILSSTLVRSRWLQDGFPAEPWARGIEDYALWLSLVDRGALVVALGDALIAYDDSRDDRLSMPRRRRELALARLFWRRVSRAPADGALWAAALRWTAGAASVAVSPRRSPR